MAVDNRIETVDALKNLEKPWEGYRDIDATADTFAKYYAGGTPDWFKWPQDYKNFAKEEYEAHREQSEALAEDYKLEDQSELVNETARKVNIIETREFIRKLRANGVKCFTVDNGFPPKTVALWCMPPNQAQRARYVCYLQIPAMYEWSVLRTDRYGKPEGEKFRGWRTVLVQLVEKEILTEFQIHQIFGRPSDGRVFQRYQRSLWEFRNGKRYTHDEVAANDV